MERDVAGASLRPSFKSEPSVLYGAYSVQKSAFPRFARSKSQLFSGKAGKCFLQNPFVTLSDIQELTDIFIRSRKAKGTVTKVKTADQRSGRTFYGIFSFCRALYFIHSEPSIFRILSLLIKYIQVRYSLGIQSEAATFHGHDEDTCQTRSIRGQDLDARSLVHLGTGE